MHKAGWAHLDIKAANILVKGEINDCPDEVRLSDYGLSFKIGGSDYHYMLPQVEYMPQEMFNYGNGNGNFTVQQKLDWCMFAYLFRPTGRWAMAGGAMAYQEDWQWPEGAPFISGYTDDGSPVFDAYRFRGTEANYECGWMGLNDHLGRPPVKVIFTKSDDGDDIDDDDGDKIAVVAHPLTTK